MIRTLGIQGWFGVLLGCGLVAAAGTIRAAAPAKVGAASPRWLLVPAAEVDGSGVFLSQVIAAADNLILPRVRLADAPDFGQARVYSRDDLMKAARRAVPELVRDEWGGAMAVKVSRRVRAFSEADLLSELTAVLQRDHVGEMGELELRATRPWKPVMISDDPVEIKILDLPNQGVTAYFVVRFELRAGDMVAGTWHVSLQGAIWRDTWVAKTTLGRGTLLTEEVLVKERRDVLGLRLAVIEELGDGMELIQQIRAGTPLYARSVRLRPVVFRGQMVDATVYSGPIQVTLKVEALQDGAPGDMIRVRNTQSRKEFRGKVQNEQTILVSL